MPFTVLVHLWNSDSSNDNVLVLYFLEIKHQKSYAEKLAETNCCASFS